MRKQSTIEALRNMTVANGCTPAEADTARRMLSRMVEPVGKPDAANDELAAAFEALRQAFGEAIRQAY